MNSDSVSVARNGLWTALLGIALVFLIACHGSQENARQYIEMSERQWAESVATNDSSVVERILADDFVWIAPDGTRWTKAETVADARKGPGNFVSNHLKDVSIRFYGNVAVAQGSESWIQKDASKEWPGRFVWTDVWVYRDGKWQIVASEDLIPPTEQK